MAIQGIGGGGFGLGGGGNSGNPGGTPPGGNTGGPTGPSGGGNTGGSAILNALNNSVSVGELSANDISNDATPIIPAGAYDYGSGKVYTAFTVEDVVEGNTQRVTRGLWSGNVGELTTFFTSSFQSTTQKGYYYEIYNGDPTDSTKEAQFSIAYGHYAGSGSLGTNEDSPSNAIYSQFQQVLLPALNQQTFVGDPKSYITTVGLYNNDNELLAIAKLSKPLLKSFSNEILIKVKLDF
jgi:hypothetical protein